MLSLKNVSCAAYATTDTTKLFVVSNSHNFFFLSICLEGNSESSMSLTHLKKKLFQTYAWTAHVKFFLENDKFSWFLEFFLWEAIATTYSTGVPPTVVSTLKIEFKFITIISNFQIEVSTFYCSNSNCRRFRPRTSPVPFVYTQAFTTIKLKVEKFN